MASRNVRGSTPEVGLLSATLPNTGFCDDVGIGVEPVVLSEDEDEEVCANECAP
jgi:hypothetical protein